MAYFKEMYGTQSKEFIRGVVAGVKAYAWWQDGTQYVGTSGKTLKTAIKNICEELGWKEEWGKAEDY